MSQHLSARIQTLLEGVPLPAGKRELLAYAKRQGDDPEAIARLRELPDARFRSLDDVGEALDPVQPCFAPPRPNAPRPESGTVPGGKTYLDPSPESGAVRSAEDSGYMPPPPAPWPAGAGAAPLEAPPRRAFARSRCGITV